MPLNLANLKHNTRSVSIDYFGEPVNLTYRPSEMTPATEAELQGAADEERTEVMVRTVARLVTAWDVMDGDEPLPITADVLRGLPSAFLLHVLDGIQADMRPKAKTGRR